MRYIYILLCLVSETVMGQQSSPALQFMLINPDARGAGMGNSGVGTSPDNSAAFYNPAKYAFCENYGLTAGYSPWLRKLAPGMGLVSMEGFRKVSDREALGLDLRFFSLGRVDFKDQLGYDVYTYAPTEYTIGVSYSKALTDQVSLGAGFRYLYSRPALGDVTTGGPAARAAGAVGADVGIYYSGVPVEEVRERTGFSASFGACLQNIGTAVHYYKGQPLSFQPSRLSVGWTENYMSGDLQHHFDLSFDVGKLLVPGADSSGIQASSVANALFKSFKTSSNYCTSVGIEYGYRDAFFLRAGMGLTGTSYPGDSFWSCGLGLQKGPLTIGFSTRFSFGSTVNPYNNGMFQISVGVIHVD